MDSAALARLDSEFSSGRYGYVNGFLVIRHGAIVYERSYSHDYDSLFATAPDQKRGPYNYYDPSWHPYYQGAPRPINAVLGPEFESHDLQVVFTRTGTVHARRNRGASRRHPSDRP